MSFFFVCLIVYVPSTIVQLYRDGSSWAEPELSYAVTPVRLEPVVPLSQVKHSTTEPPRSPCTPCLLGTEYVILSEIQNLLKKNDRYIGDL